MNSKIKNKISFLLFEILSFFRKFQIEKPDRILIFFFQNLAKMQYKKEFTFSINLMK